MKMIRMSLKDGKMVRDPEGAFVRYDDMSSLLSKVAFELAWVENSIRSREKAEVIKWGKQAQMSPEEAQISYEKRAEANDPKDLLVVLMSPAMVLGIRKILNTIRPLKERQSESTTSGVLEAEPRPV